MRLIPARAGNISIVNPRPRRSTAHPRSRGEHILNLFPRLAAHGSSPLARGTYDYSDTYPGVPRLIPARAGNIMFTLRLSVLSPAHPRSRGEHAPRTAAAISTIGSSPLARGTYAGSVQVRQPGRLIPARAGNMRTFREQRLTAAAHPRSRGEHRKMTPPDLPHLGSSPLARGTSASF